MGNPLLNKSAAIPRTGNTALRFPMTWPAMEAILAGTGVNIYFCASFVIVVVAVLLKFPALVISAEFYAETADIFFRLARSAGLWDILTYISADYLVTFQLLVSVILVRVFGIVEHFPGTVNFLFLLFVAFSVSLINLQAFRVLIASDFLRFIIGVSIGLTPNFEVYELLHANLFGFMIYLLFIFVDKDQFKRWLFYLLTVLLFLVGIARPNLVAFLPVYLVLLGIAIRSKHVRDMIFYGAGTVSLALQSYVLIMAQLQWTVHRETGIYNDITGLDSFIDPVFTAVNHYLRTLISILFNHVVGFYQLLALILLLSAVILLSCYFLYRRKRYRIIYFFGLSQLLALGLIYFITFSSPSVADWSQFYYYPGRWWVYSNYVIYISLLVLAYNTTQELLQSQPASASYPAVSRMVVVGLALFPVLFNIYPFYRYEAPFASNDSLSNWEKYRHLLNEEDYYIPVNPVMSYQWGIAKDNRPLDHDINASGAVSGILIPDTTGELLLRSLVIVNNGYAGAMKDLVVKAYDGDGRETGVLHRLNGFEEKYLYYYFTERASPRSLKFFDENSQQVYLLPELKLFGKLEPAERLMISGLPD
jgi:hypothetical protein